MPGIVLIGAQWGDEGKGKATDLIGTKVDYVARFNGGNNAGHTVVVGDESYALHLLPSGIISPTATPVIGNGVVVDPEVLLEEIEGLESRGIDCSRLLVSESAHVIAPYHRMIDKVTERFAGKKKIGTTGRGIGPAYADKINRVGIRIADLFHEDVLRDKVSNALHQKNQMLVKLYNRRAFDVEATVQELLEVGVKLKPYVANTSRQDRAVRGRSGHAARHRPRHLPVRHLVEPDRRRRLHRHRRRTHEDRPCDRRLQGLRHPSGRRAVPHRAVRRKR